MNDLIELLPKLWTSAGESLVMVTIAMIFGGIGGLLLGLALYLCREGNLLANRAVYVTVNVLVNTFRPIPFVIFIGAIMPLSRLVVGTGIGGPAFIFAMSLAASFGISRLVEQNLLTVGPGVIEAARAAGASPFRIIRSVLLPEALGPLILGYTFALIAVVDMSAIAGAIGGGGLGNFALQYGYRQMNPWVTWAAVLVIIVIVQTVQLLGNAIARRLLRR